MHRPGTDHTVYVNVPCEKCKVYNENNPDPSQWTLVKHEQRGDFLALWVTYDNIKADKFEKNKVMVVKADLPYFLKHRALDPHFSKEGIVKARFMPTHEGWLDAIDYINYQNRKVGTRLP
jgi:hypothetical protein